jgi:hypothetical protein
VRGDAKSLSDVLFSKKTKAIVWGMQTRAVQVSILWKQTGCRDLFCAVTHMWNENSKHINTVSVQLQNTVHSFVFEGMYSCKCEYTLKLYDVNSIFPLTCTGCEVLWIFFSPHFCCSFFSTWIYYEYYCYILWFL